jgi:hypothetical protein
MAVGPFLRGEKMKVKLIIAGLLAAACTASAFAGPAAYQWYQSRVTGERVCANAYMGSGWVVQPQLGSFKDAHCSIPK